MTLSDVIVWWRVTELENYNDNKRRKKTFVFLFYTVVCLQAHGGKWKMLTLWGALFASGLFGEVFEIA